MIKNKLGLIKMAVNSEKRGGKHGLEPRVKTYLDQLAATGGLPDPRTVSIEDRRKDMELLIQSLGTEPGPVGSIDDRLTPGPDGQIPIGAYSPEGSEPFPVLVYFHGGLRREMGKEVWDGASAVLQFAFSP